LGPVRCLTASACRMPESDLTDDSTPGDARSRPLLWVILESRMNAGLVEHHVIRRAGDLLSRCCSMRLRDMLLLIRQSTAAELGRLCGLKSGKARAQKRSLESLLMSQNPPGMTHKGRLQRFGRGAGTGWKRRYLAIGARIGRGLGIHPLPRFAAPIPNAGFARRLRPFIPQRAGGRVRPI
jgi:hypothetical protein